MWLWVSIHASSFGSPAASCAACASSGRRTASVVPWTISSGVGVTSDAWEIALNVRYGSSDAPVVSQDQVGAWSRDVRS